MILKNPPFLTNIGPINYNNTVNKVKASKYSGGDRTPKIVADTTNPEKVPPRAERHAKAVAGGAVGTGVATEFWLELKPYPPGSARSLWLNVGGWRRLDNPSHAIQHSVQDAFCQCPDKLEVAVWYQDQVIVGLVVRSK